MSLFNQEIVMSTKNVLTAPEVYKLTQWLDQNPIPVQTMTQAELALLAASVLRFEVTASNCIMAGKNLNIQVGRQNHGVYANRNNTQILAHALCELYRKLNELIPEDLARLAK